MLEEIVAYGSLGDSDLLEKIDETLAVFPVYKHCPETVDIVSRQLQSLLKQEKLPGMDAEQLWHFQIRFLNVLEKFYMNNIYILNDEQRNGLLATVCKLLHDPNLEVRQTASIKLTGLIRCSPNESILQLKVTMNWKALCII